MSTSEQRPREQETLPVPGPGIMIPALWENPTNLPMLFANHLFVRRQDDYVILTFGQAELPYETQLDSERIKEIAEEGLPIQVVARLATTQQKLNDFIRHLSNVRDTWPKGKDQPEAS